MSDSNMNDQAQREVLIDALVKIRALKRELEQERQARHEPIAIIGAGCRFPGDVNSPEQFWALLRDGIDAMGPMPPGRFDTSRYPETPEGGFLKDVAGFDPDFFDISPREARTLDPQQRLLLEVAWEALENAALAPDKQSTTTTGVFIGIMSADYAMRQAPQLDHDNIDPYMLTGNDMSFTAGRLAYFLGLNGPTMAVSTACSSSLVAVHLACQALRNGECDQALAGGVNVILDPVTVRMLTKLRALAPDGRSKGFDASANGYGRGEGCGMVVLKRLSDAVTAGDRIVAVIRGSAMNHDGASAGLTVPNGVSQERLIRRALTIARLEPNAIDYIEAHGTGTALGDPIEAHALGRVFGPGRTAPLPVGSVKSNVGHLESAAGVAGLLKTALAVQHGVIPRHLHFKTPSPHINWSSLPIQVASETRAWPQTSEPRRAGISSFGLSGVNAHAVLEQAPPQAWPNEEPPQRDILAISARTATALKALVEQYRALLGSNSDASWNDICRTANTGRAHFAHRVAVVADSTAKAAAILKTASLRTATQPAKVAFLFEGDDVKALQAEYEQWLSWGVEPDLMAGEGAGEYSAACAAGVFSQEDAERLMSQVEEPALAMAGSGGAATFEREITFNAPRTPLVSGLTGEAGTREFTSPDYWRRLRTAATQPAREVFDRHGVTVVVSIPGGTGRNQTLETLANLYCEGVGIDWNTFYKDVPRRPVVLPTYPFERTRHWALDPVTASQQFDETSDAALPEAIANRVAAMLGIREAPGTGRSLIDVGLDSLMASELCDWARTKRGIAAEPSDVLSAQSINALAQLWESRQSEPAAERTTAAETSTLPLSYGQKALWFIYQSDPASSAYNVGIALRIRAEVSVGQLQRVYQTLIDRHAALRTTFHSVDGEPVQRVHESSELSFVQVALAEGDLQREVQTSCNQPFDLEHGPLMRVRLFSCAPDHHVLLIAKHHIISDALSYWTVLEELQTLYAGGTLKPPTATYADFLHWQQKMISGDEGERHWNYWQKQLGGDLPVLNLPLDYPRPAVQRFIGGTHQVTLPATLTQSLRELARRERVTLFTTLLAAFHTLLHRYSGQDDIIVGAATAGRPSQFTGVLGYFVNPVPVRVDLSGNPSFLTLLAQVRRNSLDAMDHHLYPFPLLVERLKPKRDPSRSPIFQADFALRKSPANLRGASRLPMEPFSMAEEEGQFDLSLHITENPQDLEAHFKYNSTLLTTESAARIAECFLTLVENIVGEPSLAIDEIPMLTEAECARLINLGVGPRVDYPQIAFPRLFEIQAEKTPDAIAAESGAGQLTYAELDSRSNQLARYLQAKGLGPESLVGVCLPRGLNLITAILAVMKAGGAYVPLDPSYPAERLSFLIEDAGMPLIIADGVSRTAVPEGKTTLDLDQEANAIASQGTALLDIEISPEQLAYSIYTSGSTGKPKGALIPHRGLTNYLCWAADAYRAGDGIGAPVNTAIGFDATITSLLLPLMSGGKIVLLPEQGTIESLTETLRAYRNFSLVKLTPAHLEILSRTMPPDECAGRANAFVIGGEALRGDMLTFWQTHAPATRLINEYGPTETVVGCCIYEAATPLNGSVPIGRPIANTRLYVLDRHLQPVPFSVTGELYIGGAGVARGYRNRPELNAERFLNDPFSPEPGATMYRTGDLVRYLPDGNLDFLGRSDSQVKIRGYRIETGEIESVLSQHPSVAECIIDVREDQPGNKSLAAYVVGKGAPPSVTILRSYLGEHLPDYMIPSAFVVLDTMPLTPNGKVDRKALPAPIPHSAKWAAPRDPLEMKIAGIWEQVLNIPSVGVRDNFFELGGHSLLAVKLMARMQQEFGDQITLASIVTGPTVEQLARLLRQASHQTRSPLVAIQTSGSKLPFFCVPGAGGNVIYLHSLAHHLGADRPFYGMQGAGIDGEAEPHTTVEQMASYYMEAIRKVQPEGPYHIGGHSLGGWVAYEMARRFEAQGETVAALGIIDTPAPLPGSLLARQTWDNAKWIAELANRIGQLLNPELAVDEEALRGLDETSQLLRFQEALVKENLFPSDAGTTHLRNVLTLFKAHSQVRYAPSPLENLHVPIALFRTAHAPSHLPTIAEDEGWGWGAHGRVVVHHVSGEHLSVLRTPHVELLAKKLSELLQTVSAEENACQPL